LTAVLSRG